MTKTNKDNYNQEHYNIDDDEPIYNLEDLEDDNDSDAGDGDSEEGGPGDDDNPDKKERKNQKLSPLRIMFKTMMTPVEGWKSLWRAKYKPEEVSSRCFYPLIALAAITVAANFYYTAGYTFTDWVIQGLVVFISFFFGYFSVILLGASILPKKSRNFLKTDIGKQFVLVNMSTLALFASLIQLFPMLDPVLVFLPIWTIYLIFKGIRVYHIDSSVQNTTTVWMCILIIGAPILWNWIFAEFLIQN